MEMFLASANLKMNHIAYKGPAPATQDVLAGQVPCGFLAAPAVGPHVKDGKLNALGVSGTKRSPASPLVPTLIEAGVANFDASFFELLAAPKNNSPQANDRFQKAVVAALSTSETKAKLNAADLDPVANSAQQAQQRIKADAVRWGKVASQINLQLD